MMKDLACLALSRRPSGIAIVPPTNSKGQLVPTKPTDVQTKDVGKGINFIIREQRERPKVSTQGKATPGSSILAPTSTSKPVSVSSRTTNPSTLAVVSSMVLVSYAILHSLVDI